MTDFLYERLRHSDPAVRKGAAQALWRRKDARDLPTLQRALQSEVDPGVTKWLAYALARIGDITSIRLIDSAMEKTPVEDTRDWLVMSRAMLLELVNNVPDLRRIKDLLSSGSTDARREGAILSWQIEDLPGDMSSALLHLAEDQDPGIRRWSLLSLGHSVEVPSSAPFVEHLADPHFLVREWSAHTLAGIRDPAAFLRLLDKLDDVHPRVREWAIKAVGAYDDPGVPLLLMSHYVHEPDELCREGIIASLQRWSTMPDVERFLVSQINSEKSLVVLFALVEVIQSTPEFRVSSPVIDALFGTLEGHPDPVLHSQVLAAILEFYSDEELRRIGAVLGSGKLRRLFDYLEHHTNGEEVPILPQRTPVGTTGVVSNVGMMLPRSIYARSFEPAIRLATEPGAVRRSLADVGIIIALKEEFREFVPFVMAHPHTSTRAETRDVFYEFFCPPDEADVSDHRYACVVTLIAGMGPTRAAVRTERLLTNYDTNLLVNLGISAAVGKDVRLGDLVIGEQRRTDRWIYRVFKGSCLPRF